MKIDSRTFRLWTLALLLESESKILEAKNSEAKRSWINRIRILPWTIRCIRSIIRGPIKLIRKISWVLWFWVTFVTFFTHSVSSSSRPMIIVPSTTPALTPWTPWPFWRCWPRSRSCHTLTFQCHRPFKMVGLENRSVGPF